MTAFANWPSWMTFIIVLAMIGPVMRFVFGGFGRHLPPPDRFSLPHHRRLKGKHAVGEIARLDSALAERDEVIEDLQRRLTELESRLDFTERLLATRETRQEEPMAHSS